MRVRTSGRSTSSISRWPPARSSVSSGPTAPGRPPRRECSPPGSSPRRERRSLPASTWWPTLAKQLIGVVSQTNTLDRQLTVWENLYFHGRLFGIGAAESRRLADELLGRFHLSKWAKASVYALSGGMAQRLMVARSIFHRPAVLFLDEPTAGLDPQSRLALWDILGELNADGQTILLTTH